MGKYWIFISVIFLFGVVRSGLTAFLTNFHKQTLKLETLDINIQFLKNSPLFIVSICSVVFELLCLQFSKNILSALGLYYPILIAGIIQVVRLIAYTMLQVGNK